MLNENQNCPVKTLDMGLFRHPTKEYRGAPFWAWNGRLDKEKLEKQIACFRKMGFGGYHIHPRQGLATEYLSNEFLEFISYCVQTGKEQDMYSYLYDEDRWPSGYAGGLVTAEPKFRQRILCITTSAASLRAIEPDAEVAFEKGLPYLVGCYDIEFDQDGFLKNYHRVSVDDKAEHEKYYAFSKTVEPSGRYNFQTSVDIMSAEAIQKFIEVTHERFYEVFGDEYGRWIPSIFSDEPRHEPLEQFSEANPEGGALYYWSYGMEKSFEEKYGYSLIEKLPYLVWDTANGNERYVRYHFFNHAEDLFEHAFMKQIREVTRKQKLGFTGHLMNEHELLPQISRNGEAMRLYPYFDIPGIDVLFDRVELSTAKQTQSIVHQYGKKGMLSELYGVTGWDFDFRCLKMQGDWQAALGVTLRVPHLSWMSMAGRAKRDYPASFNYQSPWHEEFKYVEDHFARLNTVLTRGKALVNVAVLHPIETTMLCYSTKEKSAALLKEQETKFQNLIQSLLYSGIDFDFLSEALLPDIGSCKNGKFRAGQMEYDAVIVPAMETVRKTTLTLLEAFREQGGKLIFVENCPQYVDGVRSDEAKKLYESSIRSQPHKTALIRLLEEERTVRLQNADGTDTEQFIYQFREDTDCHWLFVAQAKKLPKNSYERSSLTPKQIRITVKGEYRVVVYDTLSGNIRDMKAQVCDGQTQIDYSFYANDSLLLRMESNTEGISQSEVLECGSKEGAKQEKIGEIVLWDSVSCYRNEANVLLLDVGRYSVDGITYSGKEYVLEMNTQLAKQFDINYSDAQPYVYRDDRKPEEITVRFSFESETDIEGVLLAAERMEECSVFLNGILADGSVSGYYVDESIKTIELPIVKKGKNILDIRMPFSSTQNIEACYLLGEFNVRLKGVDAILYPISEKIGFAPLPQQGMPFYGGNVIYRTEFESPEGTAKIRVSDFGAHCVRVYIDGEDAGLIAFAPFTVEKKLTSGIHWIEFLCYGNRNNTFGPVHNKRINDGDYYIEPNAWEKSCEFWRNSYFLQDTGILNAPIITFYEDIGRNG